MSPPGTGPSSRRAGPWRRLWPYLARYQRSFALGLLCIVAANAIQLASPWILKLAIDDLTAAVTRAKLLYYAALMLGVSLVGAVFRFLMRRIIIGISRHIEYDLRNDFFAHLQAFPVGYFQANRTGDLMSRATNDLNAVRMMVGPSIMYSASTILTFIVAIVVMVSIDPWLTLVGLAPLPLVSISVKVFGSAIHSRFETIQAQLSEISAVVQEALSGVRVVRAYGQEAHERTGAPRTDRDAWEDALLNAAIELEVPFLGICRGAQVLNVALGGTLVQHLPDLVGHEGYQPAPAVFGEAQVTVERGSRLDAILGDEDEPRGMLPVHVYHHQAIDRVADGLTVTARTDEGVIEAVELDGAAFGVAVQWHPEENAADRRLFAGLVETARTRRAERSMA